MARALDLAPQGREAAVELGQVLEEQRGARAEGLGQRQLVVDVDAAPALEHLVAAVRSGGRERPLLVVREVHRHRGGVERRAGVLGDDVRDVVARRRTRQRRRQLLQARGAAQRPPLAAGEELSLVLRVAALGGLHDDHADPEDLLVAPPHGVVAGEPPALLPRRRGCFAPLLDVGDRLAGQKRAAHPAHHGRV